MNMCAYLTLSVHASQCLCVCVTIKLPSIVFVVTTQGKAKEVNAVGKVMVAYVYTTSVREYTMQARIGKVPFILGVRDYTMQARIGKVPFILGVREYTCRSG